MYDLQESNIRLSIQNDLLQDRNRELMLSLHASEKKYRKLRVVHDKCCHVKRIFLYR